MATYIGTHKTPLVIAVIILFFTGIFVIYKVTILRGEMRPPNLEFIFMKLASARAVEFISWSAQELSAYNEQSLQEEFGQPAIIEAGINYMHVSNTLLGSFDGLTLQEIKKIIDPSARNILLFIYKNDAFFGEKTGPYNSSNIRTDIDSIRVNQGDALIVISQKSSKAYGLLNATTEADDYFIENPGWNLVALTQDELDVLLTDPANYKSAHCEAFFCDATSIWLLAERKSSRFEKVEKLYTDPSSFLEKSNFIAWIRT